MSVIPHTHLDLSRTRRDLGNALSNSDWTRIADLDKQLVTALQTATEDPSRDSRALMGELGQIVSLYKTLVENCQLQVQELAGQR